MRGLRGPIAQLGERRVRNAEVVSSILILSTNGYFPVLAASRTRYLKRPSAVETNARRI